MSDRALEILRTIARQRPALETMKSCTLVLPLEQDTVAAVLAALDEAEQEGLLTDGVVLPDGAGLQSTVGIIRT